MTAPSFVPFADRYLPATPADVALATLHDALRRRRSVRMFSDRPVAKSTIEWLVRCAHTAPSGANKQPWRFVCVQDPAMKARIRAGAEAEEHEFYTRRANAEWRRDLEPLGTDEHKQFLTTAPWLVVVFQLTRGDDGSQVYYLKESVGLACGMLLAAAQLAGLATLTHTPSPMAFRGELLGRPAHERPFLLIPVGHASDDCVVPAKALERRPLDEVMVTV
ncbi:MAG: nitroreductase family protein [Planctomycetes bacterium]|nr:nitroreductase family protein [Planctomycetota bacterium]